MQAADGRNGRTRDGHCEHPHHQTTLAVYFDETHIRSGMPLGKASIERGKAGVYWGLLLLQPRIQVAFRDRRINIEQARFRHVLRLLFRDARVYECAGKL